MHLCALLDLDATWMFFWGETGLSFQSQPVLCHEVGKLFTSFPRSPATRVILEAIALAFVGEGSGDVPLVFPNEKRPPQFKARFQETKVRKVIISAGS